MGGNLVPGSRRFATLFRIVAAAFGLVAAQPAFAGAGSGTENPLVVSTHARGGFALVSGGAATPILIDRGDDTLIVHAAADFAEDLAAVSGVRPDVVTSPAGKPSVIIIGTLGHSAPIDRLVSSGKLDAAKLGGAWESFIIATVADPAPGVAQALVIAGSDRRGTAFGVYELSEAIGVSPWSWWADVAPQRKETLVVPAGTRKFGPPSVRYRGLFINDEDWGLFPWSARTFDPKGGNIGPKTYERVFELLLRLKANTLWPAMHKTTAAFNADPANARLADEYGIVVGTSHAEPMLRNNVGEWNDAPDQYNYATNAEGVRTYWEERVRENASYESLWTLGMRGIHDSGMVGGGGIADRVALLDRIIADQRKMLHDIIGPDPRRTPQMFVPYKEVLELYRNGLKVPEDVTIVWPDDNFGYIRQFPSDDERKRPGGSGVYYHLSYLGAPLSYLWLSTTPPALVQEEMTRAYDQGARTIWIANVGDIKPAEIGMSHFFDLAWDIGRWRGHTQRNYLDDWASRTFDSDTGRAIGGLLDSYFRLNFERRPEHLWWQNLRERSHSFSSAEVDARLRRLGDLESATIALRKRVPPSLADAYFQLIEYPIRASAAANLRYFGAERYAERIDDEPAFARSAGAAAIAADEQIKRLTRQYNEQLDGKWRWIMAEEPADNQWRQYRTAPIALPAPGLAGEARPFLDHIARADLTPPADIVEAENYARSSAWRIVEGLGRGRGTMMAQRPGARMQFRVTVPDGEARSLQLGLLPLFPNASESALVLDVSVDDGAPRRIEIPREAQTPEWSQAVLDNLLRVGASDPLPPGRHEISVIARSSGVALDRMFLIAPETKAHGGH
ncbi:hypothetical protein GCM10011494_05710 [Novosphingobium endophyticum]|uniref:Gylcosyl hydrolase 115 C-terminal domain-containing protein n=1 Tax=Novosphingobium endophyticum TaxID=1955250 RepID=A0A916TPC8_9SPHN|nr:glycosyl hydrolase 115 family protein [Novosphingobium endophyticum]GGB90229.1 hypothetical protein GCM10011494_05710 [Novosphingobium endophyticum]